MVGRRDGGERLTRAIGSEKPRNGAPRADEWSRETAVPSTCGRGAQAENQVTVVLGVKQSRSGVVKGVEGATVEIRR